jgi:hypothetical protein
MDRAKSFSRAALADVDGIKASVATQTSTDTYTGAELDGVEDSTDLVLPRTVSLTTTSVVGAYALAGHVFTGTYRGAVVTETLTTTLVNGGETLFGTQLFDTITQIDTPAHADTDGTLEFGVNDAAVPAGEKVLDGVKAHAAGNIGLEFQDGSTDTLVAGAHVVENVGPTKVLGQTTTAGVTIYYGMTE